MPSRHRLRRVLALTVGLAVFALSTTAATVSAAELPAPMYLPPVDAPIVDGFRPPATEFGPGNRGIDYATLPGTPVRAAAAGTVVFSGQVGGVLHVVVLHPDGLRTTYSLLASAAVHRGDRVEQGDVVGQTGPDLHFGVRDGDQYIDPATVFARPASRVRLVPDNGRGLPPESAERSALERLGHSLKMAAGASARAVAWLADTAASAPGWVADTTTDTVRAALSALGDPALTPVVLLLMTAAQGAPVDQMGLGVALAEWSRREGGCTLRTTPTPGPIAERRLAVLVGGLGSSAGHASILDLPTRAMGYRPEDTVQFSYRGGTTEDTTYGPADTQIDLRTSGKVLRMLLVRLAAAHPGVPIDLFAHSQGGLVVREALTTPLSAVSHVVLLGTPNGGADLAALVTGLKFSPPALTLIPAAEAARPLGLDPLLPIDTQLGPGSAVLRSLPRRMPVARVTSIGASTDWVVPAPRTWLAGARNIVVSVPGLNAHARLPGSAAVRREAALAVHDLAPSCESLFEAVKHLAAETAIEAQEAVASAVVRR